MRTLASIAFVVICALLAPPPSSAQSLAEAAAKEKARRKALTPGKVYTEADLRRAGGEAPPASTAAATDETATPEGTEASPKPEAAPGAAGAEKPKSDDEIRAEKQKDWNKRVAKANEEISRLNTEIAAIEAAVGDIRQNLYGSSRAAQMTRLAEDKEHLATAQKTLEDLQEEGRRNGYR
jgi:hypothetical protein